MHIYNTLIIGSSYMSAGFAVTKENCIICERTELCDSYFGASLCCNKLTEYEPQTADGRHLLDIYNGMGIINNGYININAFECALSKYIIDKNIEVLLKCRVTDISKKDGIYTVTIITNSGIEKIYTENIKDYSCSGKDFITVQFVSNNIENDFSLLKDTFGDIRYERTFYSGRYSLFVPSHGMDINMLKLYIYEKWQSSGTKAKILHIPSALFSKEHKSVCDGCFDSFLEAFEYGIKEALVK